MPVYITRLDNGKSLIGEADSEAHAREIFLARWKADYKKRTPRMLSIRKIPKNTFLTEWRPVGFSKGCLAGTLEGKFIDPWDDCGVCQREYPAIDAVHQAMLEKEVGDTSGDEWNLLIANLESALKTEAQRGKELTRLPSHTWRQLPNPGDNRIPLACYVRWII